MSFRSFLSRVFLYGTVIDARIIFGVSVWKQLPLTFGWIFKLFWQKSRRCSNIIQQKSSFQEIQSDPSNSLRKICCKHFDTFYNLKNVRYTIFPCLLLYCAIKFTQVFLFFSFASCSHCNIVAKRSLNFN